MAITTYLSTSTLNEKELSAPIKRYGGWKDKETIPLHNLPRKKTHFRLKDIHRLKGRGWKEDTAWWT